MEDLRYLTRIFTQRAEILPEDSFYVPVDNPEVSSSRHEYFAWNSQKGDRFRSGRIKVGR